MKKVFSRAAAFAVAQTVVILSGNAQTLNLPDTPLAIGGGVAPMVMLNVTKDHQLYYKAYNDYSDLDGDGVVEHTYRHDFNYYGYFDSFKCYAYANGVFEPTLEVANPAGGRDYCGGGLWHGNFLNWLTMSRMDVLRKLLYGGLRFTDSAGETILERAYIPNDAHSWAKFYGANASERGELTGLTPFSAAQVAQGVSFCNTTWAPHGSRSQSVDSALYPPLLRVAKGNFRLWAAHERAQCEWLADRPEPVSENGNIPAASGINAATRYPERSVGLGAKDYSVRVRVCQLGLLGKETCGQYPTGNYKPVGIMQRYGESGKLQLGLITGSYNKNISGGVLRKNVGPVDDEINLASDGTFIADPVDGGIIDTLNRLRLYGWYYQAGSNNGYPGANGDNCTYLQTSFSEGDCSSWGNPLAEMYLESLRYFAGLSPTPAFASDDSNRIAGLKTAPWRDPLNDGNYCAALNVLNVNASVSSYDNDQMSGLADLPGSPSAMAETNRLGDLEGITGNDYLIGRTAADGNEYCTAKAVTALGEARGLCPEAPTLDGSYQLAGAALYAHENRIRTDLEPLLSANDSTSLKVNTYGVALATSVPKIDIPVPGQDKKVTLLPSYRLDKSPTEQGGGTLMDFQIVEPHSETAGVGRGKFYVNWEDSEQGADHDMDVWGIIEYRITATDITVTTDVLRETTHGRQGFGYVISGTTQDGPHFHSGIEGFSFSDPTGAAACSGCQVDDPPTSQRYTLAASGPAPILEDPLYYAAKYGGYREQDGIPGLSADSEWDGHASSGAAGGDGVPDNYFYVVDPGALERSLAEAFSAILNGASAAAVTTTSTALRASGLAFHATFNSADWSGDLEARPLGPDGEPGESVWSAAGLLDAIDNARLEARTIITFGRRRGDGIGFRWPSLQADGDPDQVAALNGDGRGFERLEYLRGDTGGESFAATGFRPRNSRLGDIVNSTPAFVGAPQADYPELFTPSYRAFRRANRDRQPMIYVGANDGMLHGFKAGTLDADGALTVAGGGEELLAYVPGPVYPQLAELSGQRYGHKFFVDGSPMTADAVVAGEWKTLLVGGLGKGGQGYYALDVTDPERFSEANAADIVLWEFSDRDDPDLGYTFNLPHRNMFTGAARQIVPMNNGEWAVIIGNGYNNTEADDAAGHCADGDPSTPCPVSQSGEAVVYVLFIERGLDGWQTGDFVKLGTGAGTVAGQPNGMGTPRPVDLDGDFTVDVIYAGDLQGNLWKFTVSSSDANDWLRPPPGPAGLPRLGPPGQRLFRAAAGQSITTAPEVTPNPYDGSAAYGVDTLQVLFATGKFLEPQDLTGPHQTQSVYGIWDRFERLGAPVEVPAAALVPQTLVETTFAGNPARVIAELPVNYRLADPLDPTRPAAVADPLAPPDPAKTNLGWSLDLKPQGTLPIGERVVYSPQLRYGRLYLTSLVPSPDPCAAGGHSWLMALNFLTGGAVPGKAPFDLDGDGELDNQDQLSVPNPLGGAPLTQAAGVSLEPNGLGLVPGLTVVSATDSNGSSGGYSDTRVLLSGSSRNPQRGNPQSLRSSENRGSVGRLSWRELSD